MKNSLLNPANMPRMKAAFLNVTDSAVTIKRTLCAILFLLFLGVTNQAMAADGTGVVTVTGNGGSCVGYTPAAGNGPDNWEVAEGGSYTMTITGVTECSGSAITVFVQNSEKGNFCFNATGGSGTYVGNFTMPNPSCFTSPISYKCGGDQPCDNANTFNADGPSNNNKVHLRASIFNGSCVKTATDENCEGSPCILSLSGSGLDVSCSEANDGSINITVSGQQGPVSYLWSDGSTDEDRTNLTPGTYTVTVTSGANCSQTKTFTIIAPDPLEATGVKIDETSAIGSDGSIDITVTGGIAPYTFLWSDGSTDEDRTNLPAGTYSVTVTGVHGCTTSASFEIEEYVCTITVEAGPDDVKCHTEPTMLTAISSDQAATYSWSPSTGLDNPNIANPTTDVHETTTYTVTVTGTDGCMASDEVTVTVYPIVKAGISIKPNTQSCAAPCVKLSTKSNANYSYEWRLNGSAIVGAPNKSTYCACVSGTYSVKVTDVQTGCKHTSKKFEVNIQAKLEDGNLISQGSEMSFTASPNPTSDVLNITIHNATAGNATIQLTDMLGRIVTPIYSGSISNEQTITFNMNDLSGGVYLVKIESGSFKEVQKVLHTK